MPVDTRGPIELFALRAAAALFLLAAVAGCSDGQDPGLQPSGDQPATTSNTLGQCPAGGPDATTPPAGCIGTDGQVLRP
jgi:hypothetical protein